MIPFRYFYFIGLAAVNSAVKLHYICNKLPCHIIFARFVIRVRDLIQGNKTNVLTDYNRYYYV